MIASNANLSLKQVKSLRKQRGFILLAVVLTLTVLAALAFMLSRQSAIEAGGVVREHQPDAARYVAEAGLSHALWQVNSANCSGYSNLTDIPFGAHNYSATITPSSGSPVNVSITGTHAKGPIYTIQRDKEIVYQLPATTVTLQLGATVGRDAPIDAFYNLRNWGNYQLNVSNDPSWLIHSLIYYDLVSIPSGAKILSAQLELYQKSNIGSVSNAAIDIHRITQDWTEGTKQGTGIADGATWGTTDGSLNWSGGSGGSYAAIVAASTALDNATNLTRNWDITSLVQDWVSGTYTNFGLLLKGSGMMNVAFASKEDAIADNRPKLTITYTCECGQTCAALPPAKKIYWTDDNAELIQRSDEDGANVETVISGQYKVRGLDIDTVNGKIYWSSDDFIKRANLDGSNIETVYTTSTKLNFDVKLDVAAGKMYWTYDNDDSEVMRANLDGSNVEVINTSLIQPVYFTLDTGAGYIYLTDFANGNISRMNLDGSGTTTLVTGTDTAMGSAVDTVNGKLYWTSGSANDWIKRANLDGSNVETIVTGQNAPQDIAYDADNDRIYWTEALVTPSIHRANADGSNVEIIVTGLNRPRGIIIVNADLVPPTGGGGSPPFTCSGTYRDEFNTVSYSNNNGNLSWSTDWVEINESDGPDSGDERVRDDNGPYQLWLRDNDGGGEGVEREADLSGASSATLSFLYRRSGLDNANDYVVLEISANGSDGPWTELARFQGSGTDSSYQSFSQDISSYISATTRIRLITSPNMGSSDTVMFDDIQIQCSP